MGYLLLEDAKEIKAAQVALENTMRKEFSKSEKRSIGYPGGTTSDVKVFHDDVHWYWSADHKDGATPRKLNWVGRYQTRYDLQITVELNTPYQNRVDRVGGFFAKDIDSGEVYLMHSGRIGGGTKGVGRLAFLTWLDEVLDEVVDASGRFKDGFIVMPVQGVGAAASLKRYLEKIAEFKEWVRTGAAGTPGFERKQQKFLAYYEEARGRRKGRRSAKIDYVSRHGDVVDQLNAWRSSRPVPKGQAIVKNVLIDLGVGTENDLSEIFEVKTSCCRGDLYTAIGQLIVHGSSISCKRHLVIPNQAEALPKDILCALKLQSIQVIRYDLKPRSVELIF